MKRIALLLIPALFIFGCSEEPRESSDTESLLTTQAKISQDFGMYKGIFTTLNAKYRGTLSIHIPPVAVGMASETAAPIAELTLHNDEVIIAYGPKNIDAQLMSEGVRFESAEFSFVLGLDNAQQPIVTRSQFRGFDSDIIVAKHTTQDPVTPVSGTYLCTECGGHPKLGTGLPQTFNMMLVVSDGEGGIITQTTLGSRANSGIGFQSNCNPGSSVYSSCILESGDGSTTNVGYLANGNPVIWTGNHVFNNQPTSPDDCSGIYGNWEWMSNGYGLLTGIFVSDDHCTQEISFEDFEDSVVEYVPSVAEFTDGNGDFFTRTDGSNIIGSYNLNGILGTNWFAVMDTDGDNPGLTEVTLEFPEIDGAIYYGGQFDFFIAEDDDGSQQDWDADTRVLLQYSFDGGTVYETAYGIESTGGTNTEPSVDDDLDGMGDGTTPITDTFQFQFSKPTYEVDPDSSQDFDVSVKLRIVFQGLTAGEEDISLDNVRVVGFTKGQ